MVFSLGVGKGPVRPVGGGSDFYWPSGKQVQNNFRLQGGIRLRLRVLGFRALGFRV